MAIIKIVSYNSAADKYLVKQAIGSSVTLEEAMLSREHFEIDGVWIRSAERIGNQNYRAVPDNCLALVADEDVGKDYK